MPSKVIIIVIEFVFLGINIFWALLRAHFNPRLTVRAKMSLSRAQNINSIVLVVNENAGIFLKACHVMFQFRFGTSSRFLLQKKTYFFGKMMKI